MITDVDQALEQNKALVYEAFRVTQESSWVTGK